MNTEVVGLQFGVLSDAEILSRSVVELKDLPNVRKNVPMIGSVYDPRLGTVFPGILCSTCGREPETCGGHLGHVALKDPVLTTSILPFVCKLFECLCVRCAALLLPPTIDHNTLRDPTAHTTQKRATFDGIRQQILAIHNVVQKARKKELLCTVCGHVQPVKWILYEKILLRPVWYQTQDKPVPTITPLHIYELLQMVSDEDMTILGFHTTFSRIGSFVHLYYVVPPTLIRPQRSKRSDDDITCRLRTILKTNVTYDTSRSRNMSLITRSNTNTKTTSNTTYTECEEPPEKWKPCHIRSKCPVVPYHLEDYYELSRQCIGLQDSRYCVKNDLDYGRELQSIRSRFSATRHKRGRLRASILGKRGDFTARGVASPSTHNDPDQVGVPLHVCMHVTIKDTVRTYNYQSLLVKVLNGPDTYPGANFVERDHKLYKLPYFCENGLQLGDIVHRHIVEGDLVIMNRQPSLHRYSMMGYRAYPTHHHTFQLHLAVTCAHNLDFDGDEVNMFIPGDMRSRVEVASLMSVETNTYRNGQLLIGFVQHACLGAYLLTAESTILDTSTMHQLLMISRFDITTIDDVLLKVGQQCSGREFVHALLPTYDKANNLDKRTLNTCVTRYLWHHQQSRKMYYIGSMTRIFEDYLLQHGSTLSLHDCTVHLPVSLQTNIRKVQDLLVRTPHITEHDVIHQLERVRDHVGTYTHTNLTKRKSRLMEIIQSGAKGNLTHATQNAGMIGQQMGAVANRHNAVQSHNLHPLQSRGFVQSSFTQGLGPMEYFHHLTSARIGLVATAVSTSETGYCYRRISKCIEDIRILYDYSVRDATNNIVAMHGLFNTDTFTFTNTSRLLYVRNIQDVYQSPPYREAQELYRLRTELLQDKTYRNGTSMTLPISFQDNIATQQYTNTTPTLTREHIFNIVRAACDRLLKHPTLPKNTMLEHLYMDHFASFRFVTWKVDALHTFLNHVEHTLCLYVCAPATPIGLIVSQSFSEPLTQMQLNQFHHSGERSDMVGGVVRIKEILNLYKKPSTPSMIVVVKGTHKPQPNDIVQLLLKDTIHCWTDDPTYLPTPECGMYHIDNVVYVQLHKNTLLKQQCSPRIIADVVKQHFSENFTLLTCTKQLDAAKWGLWLQFRRDNPKNTHTTVQCAINTLRTSKVLVKGVRGILDFYLEECDVERPNLNNTCLETVRMTHIVTKGSNLAGVCQIPWVCSMYTTTNNIIEMYEELGIDAAYYAIVRELSFVMLSKTTDVSYQHIQLIAKIMCRTGTPCALTFSGLSQSSTSSVKLATFERSLDSFINASTHGYYDRLNGISEAVMIGKQVTVGTGMCSLRMMTTPPQENIHHNNNTTPLPQRPFPTQHTPNIPLCTSEFVKYINTKGQHNTETNNNNTKRKRAATTIQEPSKKLCVTIPHTCEKKKRSDNTNTFCTINSSFLPWSPVNIS